MKKLFTKFLPVLILALAVTLGVIGLAACGDGGEDNGQTVALESIAITTPPTKTAYTEGESFETAGMVVTASYSDQTTKAVTSYTYSPSGALATTDSSVVVTYTEGGVSKTATQAITVAAVEVKEADFEFTGSAVIENVTYNIVLSGYDDNTFVLDPGQNAATVSGTYSFEDGIGYTFNFSDSASTVVKSTFDNTEKEHSISYLLRLGDLGSGTVTLTLKDEDFVSQVKDGKDALVEDAMFIGELVFGSVYEFTLTLDADAGTCNIECTLSWFSTTGTFTFENNVFTITVGETSYKSVYDPVTGSYTIPYVVTGDRGTFNCPLTYVVNAPVFTGSYNLYGGIDFELTFSKDGTCFVDVTTAYQSMNATYDRTGTYKIVDGNYVLTIGDKTFTSSYDAETDTYSLDYVLAGNDTTIEVTLTAEGIHALTLYADVNMRYGEMEAELIFYADGTCFLDITFPKLNNWNSTFDKTGTYTVSEGVITITIDGEDFSSTYDNETNTYSIDYTMKGSDTTVEVPLEGALWE